MFPLKVSEATADDFLALLLFATKHKGESDFGIHDLVDLSGATIDTPMGNFGKGYFKKEFAPGGGKMMVRVIPQTENTTKSVDNVMPYYPVVRIGHGKGWGVDSRDVPTTYQEISQPNAPLKQVPYPYSIAIYSAGFDSSTQSKSNERLITVYFSDIKTFIEWGKKINPDWKAK